MDLKQWNESMAYSAASGVSCSISDARKKKYEELGVTNDAMVVAMWECIFENRPEAMIKLQEQRYKVKFEIPKEKK